MIGPPQAFVETETGSRTIIDHGHALAIAHPCCHVLIGRLAALSGTVPALAPAMMADVLLALEQRTRADRLMKLLGRKRAATRLGVAEVRAGADAAQTDIEMMKGWMGDCARRWTQREATYGADPPAPVMTLELLPPALDWLFDFASGWGVRIWLPANSQDNPVWELASEFVNATSERQQNAQLLLSHCSWSVQTTGDGGALLLTSSREKPGSVIGGITRALRKHGLIVQVRPNGQCLDGLLLE